ncbi:MAG: (2Fe-2S)-binding protein [Planctomyces sp.]|nr:(2Fe-2S)-binding protein [Planctomyces sp.]
MEREHRLLVNGREHRVTTDPDRPLLDVLREDLELSGARYGCGEGECGACTVLIEGRATRTCITPVSDAQARAITTIEGLAQGDTLHPVQQAFLDEQALQCGYCIPGQILRAVDLLSAGGPPSRESIVAAMSEHICRCCNYPRILAAVEHAAGLAPATPQTGAES